MFNAQKPDPSELPSTGRLLKSTGIAAAVAGALLVFVVLPAEYGVDPTGAGSLLGLTEMGRIKMQLAEEAKAEAAAAVAATAPSSDQALAPATLPAPDPAPTVTAPATPSDEITIVLEPDDGHEVKFVMEKGATIKYVWFTDGAGVNYDTHADGEGIRYHGYGKGTNEDRLEGELTAAFTGSHGWFWRNRSGKPATITLQVTGDYSEIKQYE
jgi:hypothetical protein